MSAAAVRIGMVGCGRLAEAGHLPAIVATPSVRLVAVADPDRARRDHVGALAGAPGGVATPAFESAEALLDSVDVEALILASPAQAHLADAVLATERGVRVLVEKPPAAEAASAAQLAALEPPPWVGFNRRFDRGARMARATVPVSGALELDLQIAYRRASWAAHSVADDALLDLGPHLIDWARWLTRSEVTEVAAAELTPTTATIELATTRGRARLRAAVDRPHLERIEARDASGRTIAAHQLGGIVASVRDRLARRSGPRALIATLAGELDALASAVRGQPAPDLGTAADGLAVMQVIEAARTSATSGAGVPVPRSSEV